MRYSEDDLIDMEMESKIQAFIGLNIDLKKAEEIQIELASEPEISDIYMISGEFDLLVKLKLKDYNDLQKYIMDKLSKIDGIKGSRTMFVIGTKKEDGKVFVE
ncbi:Lrp/AsnC family transcriptional regulator [Caldiplasma sukawensis]